MEKNLFNSSVELLKNPKAIIKALGDDKVDKKSQLAIQNKLLSLSESELAEISSDLFIETAQAVVSINSDLSIIYDDIKRDNSEVKKSVDIGTIGSVVEIIKNNVEAIAALLAILESLGYMSVIRRKFLGQNSEN